MPTRDILIAINILLTTVCIIFNIRFSNKSLKNENFANINKLKIETYNLLIAQCVSIWSKYSVIESPFYEITFIDNKSDWIDHNNKEISKLNNLGYDLQKELFMHLSYLPLEVINKIYKFSEGCNEFVSASSKFDEALLMEKEIILHDLFFEVVNIIRKDLKQELLDKVLCNSINHRHKALTDYLS